MGTESRGFLIMTSYVFVLSVGVAAFLVTSCLAFSDSDEDSVSLSQLMRELQDGRVNFSSIRAHLPQMIQEFGAATYDDASHELSHEQYQAIFIPKQHAKRLVTSSQEVSDEVYQGVQGRPGIDFPVLQAIPRTSFSCRNLKRSGYYADLETDCQVFHICADGRKISFLCPNGTIFRQSHLICDWWWTVDCASSKEFYEESAEQLANDQRVYSARARAAQQQQAKAIAQQNESKVNPSQNKHRNINNGETVSYQRESQGAQRGNRFRTGQFTQNVNNEAPQNVFTSSNKNLVSHETTNFSPESTANFQFPSTANQNQHVRQQVPNLRQLNSDESFTNRRGKQRQEIKNSTPTYFQQPVISSHPKEISTETSVFKSNVTPNQTPVRPNQKRKQTLPLVRFQHERQNKAAFQDRERQQSAETASFVGDRENSNLLFQHQKPAAGIDESLPIENIDGSKHGGGFRFTTTTTRTTDFPYQLNEDNRVSNNQYRPTTPKASFGETVLDASYGSDEGRYGSEEGFAAVQFNDGNNFPSRETTTKISPSRNTLFEDSRHMVTGTTYDFSFGEQTESSFSEERSKEAFKVSSYNFQGVIKHEQSAKANQQQTTEFVKSATEVPILEGSDSETSDFDYRTSQTETTDFFSSRFKNFISKNTQPTPNFSTESQFIIANNNNTSNNLEHRSNFTFDSSTFPTTNYDKSLEYNPVAFATVPSFVNSITEGAGTYQNFEENSDRDQHLLKSDETTTSYTRFGTEYYPTERNEREFVTEINFNVTPELSTERNMKNRTKVLAYSSINLSQAKTRSESGRSLSSNDDREHLIVSSSSGIRSSGRNHISSSEKFNGKSKSFSANNYSSPLGNYDERLTNSNNTPHNHYINASAQLITLSNKFHETSPLDSATQISSLNETRLLNRNIAQPKNVNVVIIQQTSVIKDSSESSEAHSTTARPRTGRKGFDTEDFNDVDIEKQRIDLVSTAPTTGRRTYKPTTLPPKQNDKPPSTETLTSKIPQLVQLTRDLLPPKYDDPYPNIAQEIPLSGDSNVLSDAEINEYSSGNRLGLNIPPSSGPGALHSLSVYFATKNVTESTTPTNTVSQVDDIIADYVKEDSKKESNHREKLHQSESASIPPLLTELTKHYYNELFPINKQITSTLYNTAEDTTYTDSFSGTTSRSIANSLSTQPVRNQIRAKEIESTLKELEENFENVITGYSTLKPEMSSSTTGNSLKSNEQDLLTNDAPNLRALAQVFSKALAAYLDNPEEFRKALSELRPSEPNTQDGTTYRIPVETSSIININTEYPSVTKEEEEVLDFSDVTPSNGNRKHASRGRKTGKNQNISTNSDSGLNYRNPSLVERQNEQNNINSFTPSETSQLLIANSAGFQHETLQNSQSQYPKSTKNVPALNSLRPEHNTEGYSFYSQWSDVTSGADYTLPPGTTQYTGPTYGPNQIETSTLSDLEPFHNDRPRYGGFQNNSVKIEIAIHNQGGFKNNFSVNRFSPAATTDDPTKLNTVVTSFTNEVIEATTFSPVVKYVLQSHKDHPPTALVPPNSDESPWTQQINKEVVIDEILGPFIPQDLNNLAEGLINLPTASGEERVEPTQSLLENTPSILESSTSTSPNRNKHRKASNSQVIRIFVETDSDSGSLKLSTSSRKIDSNNDESLIVAPSSGFGSSILNQLSASRKNENTKTIERTISSSNAFSENVSTDTSTTTLDTTYVTDATSTPVPVSTRMEFTKSETTSRINVTKQSRKSKSRRPTTIQESDREPMSNHSIAIPITKEIYEPKIPRRDNNLENTSAASVRRQKSKIGGQLQNFGQRISKSNSSSILNTTKPAEVTERIKSQTKLQRVHEAVSSNRNISPIHQAETNTNENIKLQLSTFKNKPSSETPQEKASRNLGSRNDNKNVNLATNVTARKRSGSQRMSRPEVTVLSTELTGTTSVPRRMKSSRRKLTTLSESVTEKAELPIIYLPTTIGTLIEDQSTIPPSEVQTKRGRKYNNIARSSTVFNENTVTESLHEAMSTIDRVQTHPEEMQTLENLLMKAGKKRQMGLNDTSATALINVMRDAASNSTVRRLFLFLVNDNMKNSTLHETRSHLVDALLQLPVDVIGTASKPSLTNEPPNHLKSDTSLRHTANQNHFKSSSREGKGIASNNIPNQNHILNNSSNTTLNLEKHSGRVIQTSSSNSQIEGQTTNFDFPTTAAVTLQRRFDKGDFVHETLRSKEPDQGGTIIPPQSTATHAEIPQTNPRISTNVKQKTGLTQIGTSTTQSPDPDDSNEDSDSRAIDLLRSLYSLASKWG